MLARGSLSLSLLYIERVKRVRNCACLKQGAGRGSPRRTQAKSDNRVVIYCPVRWFNFTSAGTLSLLGHNSPEEKDYLTRNAPLCVWRAYSKQGRQRRLITSLFFYELWPNAQRECLCIAWLQSWINPKVRVVLLQVCGFGIDKRLCGGSRGQLEEKLISLKMLKNVCNKKVFLHQVFLKMILFRALKMHVLPYSP